MRDGWPSRPNGEKEQGMISKHMNITEWDHEANTMKDCVAVWGDTPQYPECIRSIVRDILSDGYAERGNITYSETEEEE